MPAGTAGGTVLAGRYRVVERLGAGGMAAVYLAHDERLDRRVAVKRMTASGDDMDVRRFEREAKLGASLSHPNLVSIFDTVQDDETVLLVMEYVEGETLADLLARGPVDHERAAQIVRGVAAALDHAHANGIVHRDIKPGNVLLGKDGSVKLADLGIAKAVERTDITRTGTVLGTPAYMAPEQFEGGALGPAVDIYSLATMAFEMLTGRRAHRGRTAVEIAHQVVNEGPPDPREVEESIPREAASAICAAMARDPGDRPERAGELASRLEEALLDGDAAPILAEPTQATRRMSETRTAPPPPTPPRPRRAGTGSSPMSGKLLAVLALLALALAALAVAVASLGGDDEPSRKAGPAPTQQGRDGGGDGSADEVPAQDQEQPAEQPQPEPEPPAGGVPQPSGNGGAEQGRQLQAEGYQALENGDYDSAIDLSRRAIEAFPPGTTDLNHAYALFNLGRALRLSGRPDEAIPVLEARLEIPNQQGVVKQELKAARKEAKDRG